MPRMQSPLLGPTRTRHYSDIYVDENGVTNELPQDEAESLATIPGWSILEGGEEAPPEVAAEEEVAPSPADLSEEVPDVVEGEKYPDADETKVADSSILTKKELLEIARGKGIAISSRARKAEIVAAIEGE